MNKPLVTVFIPVYNCENYIKDCLDSIVNQTYKNLEILLIDDGSSDNSLNIIKEYKDKRIRIIQNKVNKGIPYTRNLGLKESRGEYLAIMDADDISLKNRIEKQVDFLEKNKEIDVVGTFYKQFGGKLSRDIKEYKTSEEIDIGLLFGTQLANPTTMIRLETLRKNDISYNLECFVAQDYELWTQISKVGKLAVLPEILFKYRYGHENITKKSTVEKYQKRKRVIDSIHNNILDFYKFDLDEEDKIKYNRLFDDNPLNPIDKNFIEEVNFVLKKMIIFNIDNQVFDKDLFEKILYQAVVNKIKIQPIDIHIKLFMYDKLIDNKYKNIQDKFSIMIRHIYRKIKNRK